MGKKTVELEKKRHVNVSSWQFYLFGKSQSAQKRRWWSGSITDVCIFMTVTTQETQSNALKEFFSNPTLNLGEINEESILKSAKKTWEKIKVLNWHVGMTSPDIFFIKLHTIVNSFGCQMTWFIAIFQTLANQIFRAI